MINVKGTFRSDADEIVNEMKLLKFDALSHFFQQEADVTIHYKPYTRHIFFRLGNTEEILKPLVIFSMRYYRHRQLLKRISIQQRTSVRISYYNK